MIWLGDNDIFKTIQDETVINTETCQIGKIQVRETNADCLDYFIKWSDDDEYKRVFNYKNLFLKRD